MVVLELVSDHVLARCSLAWECCHVTPCAHHVVIKLARAAVCTHRSCTLIEHSTLAAASPLELVSPTPSQNNSAGDAGGAIYVKAPVRQTPLQSSAVLPHCACGRLAGHGLYCLCHASVQPHIPANSDPFPLPMGTNTRTQTGGKVTVASSTFSNNVGRLPGSPGCLLRHTCAPQQVGE